MKILHKAKTVLSRSSTLAEAEVEVEVEDVVQVKDEAVVVVVTTTKINNSIIQMMHRDLTLVVDVDNIEAGGVKEDVETSKEIMQIMMEKNAGIVEVQVTLSVTVHQNDKVIEGSKTTMHRPAQRGCL